MIRKLIFLMALVVAGLFTPSSPVHAATTVCNVYAYGTKATRAYCVGAPAGFQVYTVAHQSGPSGQQRGNVVVGNYAISTTSPTPTVVWSRWATFGYVPIISK